MEISFVKPFRKLLNQNGDDVIPSATLLSVFNVSTKSQLSDSFIEYDTDLDFDIEENQQLLLLLFLKPSTNNSKNIFATVRNWTEEKELFYQNQIGNEFKVIVERS
ncbi:MAG: hypothetical protein RL516_915 [Bacteroidota bacterium]|jgi:hypothetical protein